MKTFWNLLLHSNLFKIALLAGFAIVGAVMIGMLNFDNIFSNIIFGIGLVGLALYAAVFMVFAWIINPIRSLIEKRKNKK